MFRDKPYNPNLGKLIEMVSLQDSLNIQTIKLENWEKGISFYGMFINWLRYVKLETAELAESFPVKHWKDIDTEINLLNAKVELVDIWHFLISKFIEITQKCKNFEYDIASHLFDVLNRNLASPLASILHLERLELTKSFLKKLSHFEYDVSFFDLHEENMFETRYKIQAFKSIITSFFEQCNLLDFGFDELYQLYIGKNCLNQFRQDNGYKEGHYIKMWNGVEDNVVMESILNGKKDLNYNDLYKELSKRYLINIPTNAITDSQLSHISQL